jgi:DNA-3-methyladenine glycosylase
MSALSSGERSPRLRRPFFARPTLTVARELLGQRLVRVYRGRRLSGLISECEAYIGEDDNASHAFHGLTARTVVMYGEAGHAYIYFTYGMHWMLNFVTEDAGYPAAVLIRAIEPEEGIATMRRLRGREPLADGPAKLCQALAIDRGLHDEDIITSPRLFVERMPQASDEQIRLTPRIGIPNTDHIARERLWRFVLSR